jgi:hypothetical protein
VEGSCLPLTRIKKESEAKKKEEEVEQTTYWNPWVVEEIDEGEKAPVEEVEEVLRKKSQSPKRCLESDRING